MAEKRIKKKTVKPAISKPRYWMAVGTVAAYSVFGSGKAALAEDRPRINPAVRSGRESETPPRYRFDIAAGPLDSVLGSFKAACQMTVLLPENSSAQAVNSLFSPGVSGMLTRDAALGKLLEKTGLAFRVAPSGAAQLEFAAERTTVDVNDVAQPINQSMPKYQGPLLDTPQTVTVVSQKTMRQQGVTTLRDSVRNVAGISLAAGEGGAQGDNLTIRGFTARNDLFIDGMRDFGSYYRDSFNTQEVEVLQGPSSVTFGRGSTGGVVNQASKTPELNRFINADLQFGTDTTRRATLDWSAPIPKLGQGTAFRLAAMGNIGNVAGRNIALNRRTGIAPSLAFGLGSPTRVTLSYFHQNEDNIPDYGLPWLLNQPAPVNRNNFYGVEGNYLRTYADIATAKVEHDVNGKITVRNQLRYANYDRAVLISEPRVNNFTPAAPLSSLEVARNEISVKSTETFLDNQTDVVAHFDTFGLKHTFVSGLEAIRETSDPTRFNYRAPDTSLLNPDFRQQLLPDPTVRSQVDDTATSVGVYALDTVSLGRHWQASGGIRFDRVDNTYRDASDPDSPSLNRVDSKPTWRGALVYKPVANGSFYFDAGTSFNPSAETLSLSAGTANLPPESNKTYEFGTKWVFGRNRLQVDSAWFRTTKENARERDPNNSLLYVLGGTQRVSGAVVNVRGRINSRWDVLSSYSYLDSKVVNSQFYPGAVGYPLVNVPRNTFAFWSNGHLPAHFDLGLGTNYVGSRNASSTVPLDPVSGLVRAVPGYWVFNAMLSHPLNEHIDLQLNGYNLANRFYYDQLHPGHVVPGAGRSLLVGLKFTF